MPILHPQRHPATTVFSLTVLGLLTFALTFVVVEASHNPYADAPPPEPSPVVSITARGLSFEAPDEIPAGWTTLRFTNASGLTHFALLERLPDGIGVADHQADVAPLFQKGFEQMAAGQSEASAQTFAQLPKWFHDVAFVGGPGLVAPGQTAEATVRLTPGTYLLECYVKTSGVFHSYNPLPNAYGMVHEITVTDGDSRATPPEQSLDLVISSEHGIERRGDTPPRPGTHTVAVHFRDQSTYKNFVGHDVHLARLDSSTTTDTLAAWMDWTQPGGLDTPAPVSFVGGTNEMPAGQTAYFTVDLAPGRYAWVAEVPRPDEKGMLKPFTVPSSDEITTRDEN